MRLGLCSTRFEVLLFAKLPSTMTMMAMVVMGRDTGRLPIYQASPEHSMRDELEETEQGQTRLRSPRRPRRARKHSLCWIAWIFSKAGLVSTVYSSHKSEDGESP